MLHYHFVDCDSTQDALKEQIRKHGENEIILVSCETQLKGRGRGDHVWSTLPGTLCFSLGIPAHPVTSFTAIEMSVLIARFFESKGQRLQLKWPNDLFNFEGKKSAGVLVQTAGHLTLTGIGINLFSDDDMFGGVYATAFEMDKKTWCEDVARFICAHRYQDSRSLTKDWEERCLHLHQEVTITEGETTKAGRFIGLGRHGEAQLESAVGIEGVYNGSLKRVTFR